MSVGASENVAVGASVDVPIGVRGFVVCDAVEIAGVITADLAVEIAAEVTIASAMGLHDVLLLAVAFRRSPWGVCGRQLNVCGSQ